ncbi:MAG: methyltransferase [Verrucomicrobiota bacterium]
MNPQRIINMASSFYESCVLFTASDLGIFKTLSETARPASMVAEASGLDERGTTLLLNACTALGLLEKKDGLYRNTDEASAFLVPEAPGDLTGAIRYNRDVYEAWGRLPELVKTGKPVEEPEVHLGANTERTRAFVMAMHGRALGIGKAVVPSLNLEGCTSILDVGGGPGTYSILIARQNPHINSTIIDLPEIVAVADELIGAENMEDKVRTVGADYHEAEFPDGQDAVLFFGVLHQESAADIAGLLEKAFDALKPGGLVYILDMMTDATHTNPKFSALFAVNMALTARNGWVFSDAELSKWLSQAGFTDFKCNRLPPPMPHWLASALKPSK